MKKIRVAINGFGRIGRSFLRLALKQSEIDIVAINDLGDINDFAYLLKYDTVYGKSAFDVKTDNNKGVFLIDDQEIIFLNQKDPSTLPWKKLDIDIVIESTGLFTSSEKAKAHIDAGAKRVILTAPFKDGPGSSIQGETVLMGLNEDKLETCQISSNASCTTNA